MQLEILYIIIGVFIILEQDSLISIIYILFLICSTSIKLLTIKLNYITYIIIIIYLSALTILFVFVLMLTNSPKLSFPINLNKYTNNKVIKSTLINLNKISFYSFFNTRNLISFCIFIFLFCFFVWNKNNILAYILPYFKIQYDALSSFYNNLILVCNEANAFKNEIGCKTNILTKNLQDSSLWKNMLYYIGTCLFNNIYFTFILLLLILLLLLTLLIILFIL